MITKEDFMKELEEIQGFLLELVEGLEATFLTYKSLDKQASNEDYYPDIENEIQNMGAALEEADAALDDARAVSLLSCHKLRKKLDD